MNLDQIIQIQISLTEFMKGQSNKPRIPSK